MLDGVDSLAFKYCPASTEVGPGLLAAPAVLALYCLISASTLRNAVFSKRAVNKELAKFARDEVR